MLFVVFLFSVVRYAGRLQKVFAASALWAATKNGPALCRAINVYSMRASNPAFVGEGLKPQCSNQSANESGIIIRADSSTCATIPFIVANLLSQSHFPGRDFRSN
jgi:hypothetical protein